MQTSTNRRKYLTLMSEIDRRLEVLRDFQSGTASTTYLQTNIESQALQLRKILELIAYASLLPNRKAYENARNDIQKDWHASRILRKIEALNPNFYPVPVSLTRGGEWKRKYNGFLTKNQFIVLYDRCGQVLHAKNPFSRVSQRSLAFEKHISEYASRIETLLSEHLIRLSTSHDWLYVKCPDNDAKQYYAAWLSPGNLSASVIDT